MLDGPEPRSAAIVGREDSDELVTAGLPHRQRLFTAETKPSKAQRERRLPCSVVFLPRHPESHGAKNNTTGATVKSSRRPPLISPRDTARRGTDAGTEADRCRLTGACAPRRHLHRIAR